MPTATIGLKSFKIGAVATDGGMGTALTEVGSTVKGSFKITGTDAQLKDFFIEENPSAPYYTAVTEYPQLEIEGECYDVSPATAAKFLGGTAVVSGTAPNQIETYTPPASYSPIEVSAEAQSLNGLKVSVVRLLITGSPEFQMTSEELGKIKFKGKALLPNKANTAPWTYSVPKA